jgi:hypothetical protein
MPKGVEGIEVVEAGCEEGEGNEARAVQLFVFVSLRPAFAHATIPQDPTLDIACKAPETDSERVGLLRDHS